MIIIIIIPLFQQGRLWLKQKIREFAELFVEQMRDLIKISHTISKSIILCES